MQLESELDCGMRAIQLGCVRLVNDAELETLT